MIYDLISNIESCHTEIPELLYYSHIPTAIITLFVGFFILIKSKNNIIASRILFFIAISFFIWTMVEGAIWFLFNSTIMMLLWSFLPLLYVTIHVSSIYFTYVIVDKKDISIWLKYVFVVMILPTVVFLPTDYNISGFDIDNCQALEGSYMLIYRYAIGVISILWTISFIIYKYNKTKISEQKKSIVLIGVGIASFLILFSWAEIVGSFTENFNVTQHGFFGMPVLLGFLGYLIVKYKTFNVKVFGAQVLILSLIALVGSQFFYTIGMSSTVLTSVTLILTGFIGINLIRSVKKEIKAKEQIQQLADDLSKANVRLKELDQQKSEFISLASHQIRGPLASIKGYVSMVLEGDFGPIKADLKQTMETIFSSTQSLVVLVGDFLDVSRIEQGRMKYDYIDFSLEDLAKTAVREIEPTVEIKKLEISLIPAPKADYVVHADQGKMKQIILNIIDNSVKYTKEGSIKIGLERRNNKIHLFVKDTGVGIDPAVLPKLFEKFTRAPDASKTNILGTGLGLYVAKKMIEAQKGRVWAESAGVGKGSVLHIELPAKNRNTDAEIEPKVKNFATDL